MMAFSELSQSLVRMHLYTYSKAAAADVGVQRNLNFGPVFVLHEVGPAGAAVVRPDVEVFAMLTDVCDYILGE